MSFDVGRLGTDENQVSAQVGGRVLGELVGATGVAEVVGDAAYSRVAAAVAGSTLMPQTGSFATFAAESPIFEAMPWPS